MQLPCKPSAVLYCNIDTHAIHLPCHNREHDVHLCATYHFEKGAGNLFRAVTRVRQLAVAARALL